MNLSKSGISASIGVKGARIGVNAKGHTYVHAGRKGSYYRKNLGKIGGQTQTPQAQQPAVPQKQNNLMWTVSGIGAGLVLTLLIASAIFSTRPSNSSATKQTVSQAGHSNFDNLSPLSERQKKAVLAVLKKTDQLDSLYQQKAATKQFIATATPIEAEAMKTADLLPSGDARRDLMVNTFECYQKAALLMTAKQRGMKADSPDAVMELAGIRKVFLRKILSGKLTKAEKEFFDSWRKTS